MTSARIPGPSPDEREAPGSSDLARRVTVLENRFETVLPTLATKADFAEVRTELLVKLKALRADLIKWMAATLITIMLSFVGMFVGLTSTISAMPTTPHAASVSAAKLVVPKVAQRLNSDRCKEVTAL